MADGHWIYKICPNCTDGLMEIVDGEPPSPDTTECPYCGGLGVILWGYMTKDDYPLPESIPEPE